MKRAEKLGILRALPDGSVEVISPRLESAAVALAELGVGPEGALARRKLRRHADGVARAFVDLFVKEIWQPFDRAGRPEADWPKVREALDRMCSSPPMPSLPSSRSQWARRSRRPASGPCAWRLVAKSQLAARRAAARLDAPKRNIYGLARLMYYSV